MTGKVRNLLAGLGEMIDGFAPAEGPPPGTLWPFIRWCLAGSWPVIVLAAVLSGLAGGMEVGAAWLLGVLVDSTSAGSDGYFGENLGLIVLYVVFYLLLRPLFFGASAAFNGIVLPPNLAPLIQSRLHRWSLGHSVTFFDNDFAGRIAQKQMQTATALVNVVTEVINAGAFAVATLVGALAMLTAIDWRIGLALLVWLVGYFYMIRWFLPRIRVRSKNRAAARANVTGQIVDTITNIKTVKLFGHTEHEDEAAIDALQGYRQTALAFGYLSTGFRFALMGTAGLLPVILVLGAVLLWQGGQATPGEIAATGAIAMRIAQMTGWVSFTLMTVYANVGEVEDGMRTLTPPHALTDAPDATPLPRISGRIAYEDVSFAYGRQVGGVEGIDLVVEPGQKIGIVGASGAGKSTLVALLMRLYDTEAGRITLDGTDIRTVTQDSLRRQIAMVTQETAMFNRSAMENIRYGRPDASDEEVFAAARRAEAHDFILSLRDHRGREGYDAHLGERGVKLSGGQRQRIALARAFLKDAPVLVLDEATSALDSEVEAAIQSTLTDIMEGKTVIAIAHRLSTLAAMDRIIVLDAGRIVEDGTHDTLLARDGLYARYWNRQSGGFIHADAAE
ncbi:ABC transporter ATP-binding protein/permease [Roseibacterium sp. SDUM158016]|uniref:ABC transporter ATP-binding protein n=1 Tax=Roseicyclus sediminis TaxID=2980997 RepID=UPI0021D1B3AB|nr:ABC transporter ATP-binding protein [Roseibacterium sp. SDUM158016]MCU4652389.1 ABC transporter ATP-binding protein/permease [Roseibacterium sp. SDUM158016]